MQEIPVQERSFDCITISDSESEAPVISSEFISGAPLHSNGSIADNVDNKSLDGMEANPVMQKLKISNSVLVNQSVDPLYYFRKWWQAAAIF